MEAYLAASEANKTINVLIVELMVLIMRGKTTYLGKTEWIENRAKGLCHCGNRTGLKNKRLRSYCSIECREKFRGAWKTWGVERDNFLHSHGKRCDVCGVTPAEVSQGKYVESFFNVDHKIAIVNGGDEFDWKNLQVLCVKCHKKKTRIDMMKRDGKIKNEDLNKW